MVGSQDLQLSFHSVGTGFTTRKLCKLMDQSRRKDLLVFICKLCYQRSSLIASTGIHILISYIIF